VWIYMAWVIVLFGAVIAAYLPSLIAGTRRRSGGHGWQFQLALEVLGALERAREMPARGLTELQLAEKLEIESLQLEPVLETLVSIDWIGRLNDAEDEDARYIMLAQRESTPLEPLMRQLLLPYSEATEKLWQSGRLASVYLKDVI
jgi:membrane protein